MSFIGRFLALFLVTFTLFHLSISGIHCDFEESETSTCFEQNCGHDSSAEHQVPFVADHFHINHFGHGNVTFTEFQIPKRWDLNLGIITFTFTQSPISSSPDTLLRPPIHV